jgi:tetratricopeptide (TPR) repeat protein
MKKAGRAAVLSVALALVAGAAAADTPPSVWETAKDASARARYALHAKVRELLALRLVLPQERKEIPLERALSMLRDANAAASPDVRLRYDLGEVYELRRQHEEAIAILRPATDANLDHPATVDALSNLAYAYAYLGRQVEERATYKKYIPRIREDRSRLVAMLNLAEAEMHLGNLPDAIAGYRDAVALGGTIDGYSAAQTTTLAVWGLAVALDRAGEPDDAMKEATLATRMDPGEHIIGDQENVFFVPAYEREWYFGMAESVHAKNAPSLREALDAWKRAEHHWSAYARSADGKGDRYAPLAAKHQSRARAAVQRVAAQVAELEKKHPPKPDPNGDVDM